MLLVLILLVVVMSLAVCEALNSTSSTSSNVSGSIIIIISITAGSPVLVRLIPDCSCHWLCESLNSTSIINILRGVASS